MGDAGDSTVDLAGPDDEMALFDPNSRLGARKGEADELTCQRPLAQDGKAALADEEPLIHLDRPVEVRFARRGKAVGVLPDNDVALLQPQDPLRLDAERTQARLLALLHNRIPDRSALGGRHVNLVAQLAHETDPEQTGGSAA